MGERVMRELQLKVARRVPQRRDLLLAQGGAGPGRALAGSLQHHQATLLARLLLPGTRSLGASKLRYTNNPAGTKDRARHYTSTSICSEDTRSPCPTQSPKES